METFVIAFGNAFDGLCLRGPFENYDDALSYAEGVVDEDWHIVQLVPPEQED